VLASDRPQWAPSSHDLSGPRAQWQRPSREKVTGRGIGAPPQARHVSAWLDRLARLRPVQSNLFDKLGMLAIYDVGPDGRLDSNPILGSSINLSNWIGFW
jgi:hypothetical protein